MKKYSALALALIIALTLCIPSLLFVYAKDSEVELSGQKQYNMGDAVFYLTGDEDFSLEPSAGAVKYAALDISGMDFAAVKQAKVSIIWTAESLNSSEKELLFAAIKNSPVQLSPGKDGVSAWLSGSSDKADLSSVKNLGVYYVQKIDGTLYLLAPVGKISHFYGGDFSFSEPSSSEPSSSEPSSSEPSSSEPSSSEPSSSEPSSSEPSSSEPSSSKPSSSRSSRSSRKPSSEVEVIEDDDVPLASLDTLYNTGSKELVLIGMFVLASFGMALFLFALKERKN
ncbi:MAG: hypothetical protein MR014_04690 [Oscillospiraceae bacterium]|nr:hypothetical protein [Oscillospiraceae bacterium]